VLGSILRLYVSIHFPFIYFTMCTCTRWLVLRDSGRQRTEGAVLPARGPHQGVGVPAERPDRESAGAVGRGVPGEQRAARALQGLPRAATDRRARTLPHFICRCRDGRRKG
jgi:hypothetical protein